MSISTSAYAPALLGLPWTKPLDEWPQDIIVALPRGISRHVVRFVLLGDQRQVCAVKEIGRRVAHHEYRMLRELQRVGAPSVVPVAVITGRRDTDGDVLTAALVTEHLKFSLPYREIFSQELPEEMAHKLIKALAILLVRLHLLNFYWGDVSLSNTLFRRDADTFSAYLVDAETGEFQEQLSTSRRLYDVDVARVNIIGELMDLQAGGYLSEAIDVIDLGSRVETHYLELWEELTAEEEVVMDEYWRVSKRINRLGELGFDVSEMSVVAEDGSHALVIRPVVVDAGHHHKELLRLTGLEVEEQQAKRLLNAITAYRATHYDHEVELAQAAHSWMAEEYEPTIAAMPKELVGKREPAQIFHEILDHRWYMAQECQGFVPIEKAAQSYYEKVLPVHRDEAVLISEPQPGTEGTPSMDVY